MRLQEISVDGFRCLASLTGIPIHKLTVFIGENDAGKTALLDAMEVLLTSRGIVTGDFCGEGDTRASQCIISGKFALEAGDTMPADYCSADGTTFQLTKHFTLTNGASHAASYRVRGLGFSDARWNGFAGQSAQVQKQLLETIDIAPAGNGAQRTSQFQAAVAGGQLTKAPQDIEVGFAQIAEHLPRFERVSSVDYKQPDTMVQRVMHAVVDDCLRPPDSLTGERTLVPELVPIEARIRTALNVKAAEMQTILRGANPRLTQVEVAPAIDFSRSVTNTSLLIDLGAGLRPVQGYGEGSKKRLWMGLLEWEKSMQSAVAHAIVRVYDEPDINLDYTAERQLFGNILALTSDDTNKTQIVVCTHTMTFVDRAPTNCINLLSVDEHGEREIVHLAGDADDDVRDFVGTLSRSVGLSNSAFFYEKAFLLVEGESEENAIPQIYRNLYGKSLFEDGIVMVNLFSCSAWKGLLKVLLSNKAAVTVMLLDNDCATPGSSGYITVNSLSEIGYPLDYVSTSCFFVGAKEFEDAFATADILAVLDAHWPKMGEAQWTAGDIDALRQTDKFSEELMKLVRSQCELARRSSAKKPEFAARLAEHCRTPTQVPSKIQDVFAAARARAGIA